MAPTQAQLRSVNKLTFGAATHRVLGYTMNSRLERRGANHDVFRAYDFAVRTEVEGTNLSNLKSQIDDLRSQCITSAQDFRLYREDQIVYELLAAACHHGPVASIAPDGREQYGLLETLTLNVQALVPVSITAGLIDHNYTERIKTDEDGTAETVRSGQVTTAAGTSARTWIEANLPAQPGGYLRTLDISADDTDTEVTYTLTDTRSDRRNGSGTVRNHTWTETTVSTFGEQVSRVRSGQVEMVPGNSALAFINANLPATIAGFDREIQIDVADDDESGTYRVSDVETTRRNTSATVHDHQYTYSRTTAVGKVTEESWSGTVTMEDGNSARTFIEANLPAQTEGTRREVRIDTADDDLTGSYSVRDVPSEWSTIPNIENASQSNQVETDEQGRLRYVRSGYFVGANAQVEVDAVRAALAVIARIVSQSLTYDIYGDKRITFQFTALNTSDGTGIVSWQESVSKRGGKKRRVASIYPDLEPFYFFAETQPIIVDIIGRAVALRDTNGGDRYVRPPAPPAEGGIDYADWQDGDTEQELVRIDAHHCQTTWRMSFLIPVGTPIPKPRAPIAQFIT